MGIAQTARGAFDAVSGWMSGISGTAIKDVANDIATYMRPTEDEMYNAAVKTLKKKVTFATMMTDDLIDETLKNSGMDLSNSDVKKSIETLKRIRGTKNYDKMQDTVEKLNKKHNTTAFRDLLLESEQRKTNAIGVAESDVPGSWTYPELVKGSLSDHYIAPKDSVRGKLVSKFIGSKPEERTRSDFDSITYKINGYKEFFNNEDPAINRKRALTLAGGYAVAANGVRILQGGSPLKNEYGERDIAGLPLI